MRSRRITISLAPYFAQLAARPAWRWTGRVVEANGQTVECGGTAVLGGGVLRDRGCGRAAGIGRR